MDRDDALRAIREKVKNENLVRHMLATEAIMRALARRFGENEDEWGLAGLLHDIDVELVGGDMKEHSRLGSELARELGASEAVAQAAVVSLANAASSSSWTSALFSRRAAKSAKRASSHHSG